VPGFIRADCQYFPAPVISALLCQRSHLLHPVTHQDQKGKTGVRSRSLTLVNEKFTGTPGVTADWHIPHATTKAAKKKISAAFLIPSRPL
jgi:hypothetical protein